MSMDAGSQRSPHAASNLQLSPEGHQDPLNTSNHAHRHAIILQRGLDKMCSKYEEVIHTRGKSFSDKSKEQKLNTYVHLYKKLELELTLK